jgi:hypothetical protein
MDHHLESSREVAGQTAQAWSALTDYPLIRLYSGRQR